MTTGRGPRTRSGDGTAREGGAALPDYAEAVLAVVERIPPGQVMSYGDVAEYVGSGGPRQVGNVMARYGGAVPWWRVIRSDGRPPPGHEREAMARYRAEGTPLRGTGGLRATAGLRGTTGRVDVARARCTEPLRMS